MSSDVIALIQQYARRGRIVKISDEIMYDLHIDADDAEEMLSSVRERFGTELSSFCFRHYFHNEPEVFLARGLEALCALFRYRIETKKPLRVEHICRVVEAGSWFEP